MNNFDARIKELTGSHLTAEDIRTVQINLGRYCNQSCTHCHLDAVPDPEEAMDWQTMKRILSVLSCLDCAFVDLTGGAPELNPHLREFIRALAITGHRIQLRTNLTALTAPENAGLASFLQKYQVALVASLPCYIEENVDTQRGRGTYGQAIDALKQLNELGYGRDPHLQLNLVFNPGGAALPPDQRQLEAQYKEQLKQRHDIVFHRLLTINNMPIGGFGRSLDQQEKRDTYAQLLEENFNASTVDNLMCRHQICIDKDGMVYDCDFNLALGLPITEAACPVEQLDREKLATRTVVTRTHCFGCTAGAGSSCSGSIAVSK